MITFSFAQLLHAIDNCPPSRTLNLTAISVAIVLFISVTRTIRFFREIIDAGQKSLVTCLTQIGIRSEIRTDARRRKLEAELPRVAKVYSNETVPLPSLSFVPDEEFFGEQPGVTNHGIPVLKEPASPHNNPISNSALPVPQLVQSDLPNPGFTQIIAKAVKAIKEKAIVPILAVRLRKKVKSETKAKPLPRKDKIA